MLIFNSIVKMQNSPGIQLSKRRKQSDTPAKEKKSSWMITSESSSSNAAPVLVPHHEWPKHGDILGHYLVQCGHVGVVRMDLTKDDKKFQKFLLKDSTFMAALKDGRFTMGFAANWEKRIEEMLQFEYIQRIQKQIELAGGKIHNVFLVFYTEGRPYSTAKLHQDRGTAAPCSLRIVVTHSFGIEKGFQFQDRSNESDFQYSDPICAQDGNISDSFAFGKCKSSSIFHKICGVEGSVSTVIDLVSATDDESHQIMFQFMKHLDDSNISRQDRDKICVMSPNKDTIEKRDTGNSKRSSLGFHGSQKRLTNTDKVDCGIKGLKYDMWGHGAVYCGVRGLRINQGHGALDCGVRGLRVNQGAWSS